MEGRRALKTPLVSVRLNAGYGKQTVLNDLRFDLSRGERLGLLGSSGAGKSTLLLTMLGLLKHRGGWAKGEVLLDGRNILNLSRAKARKLRGKEFALVPQSPLSAFNPALTMLAHFEAAWAAHRRPDKTALHARVFALAERVGLPSEIELFKRKPGQISVGQAQRCALAMALLHRPPLIIADEPTSALDPVTQADVLGLLRDVCEDEGAGLLFVSHDLLSVFRLCSGVAVLSDGRITEQVSIADVPESRNPELRKLIHALPVPVELLLRGNKDQSHPVANTPQEDTVLALSW